MRELSWRDRLIVIALTIFTVGAFVFWVAVVYRAETKVAPQAGGQYIEGVVAQPRYVNPILSQTSDADADLVELLYAGLFDYDTTGALIKDMASDYVIAEDGKLYTVYLRRDIQFHDGTELTANDVVFTLRAIQDPAYKSPLRPNWLGVEVNAPDPYTVVFSLKKPYFGFLENLTVGILPKHIWENIPAERFTLADYNLIEPIGSGPYRYLDSDKDAQGNFLSYHLEAFPEYFAMTPYIERFTLRFYNDEESMIEAYNHDEILGIHSIRPENENLLSPKKSARIFPLALPRVFAVFLNTNKSVALAYDEVRQALTQATNRQAVLDEVLGGRGIQVSGPFLPFMFGYDQNLRSVEYSVEEANKLLDEKGWVMGDGGVRSRDGVALSFDLATPDWPELARTADILRDQWKDIGVQVEVKVLSQADLQQNVIRPREYQALLFGEGNMLDPDPYSFWHSSQKNDPGLNLAFFEEKRVDEILVEARETIDPVKRAELYQEFQAIIEREHPAVFLYSPEYLYVVSSDVQGIQAKNIATPNQRLSDLVTWYLKTKRVKK